MTTTTFTLQEAADELGVHYMTAYRYVRLGLLDARKVSGSWQVAQSAIDGFRSGSASGPVEPGAAAPWAQRLEARLVDGDAQGAWGVIEAAMASGAEVRSVYLEMLAPAMVHIGARWASGEFDIAVEHQATVIVMRIIGRLGSRCVRPGRSLGDIVLGTPEGETHALPTAILGDLMRLQGWEVNDLGANTPTASFLHAVDRSTALRGVGLSVTHESHLDAAADCCTRIKQVRPDVVVVVGGAAVSDDAHVVELGADARAASDVQFHELLIAH